MENVETIKQQVRELFSAAKKLGTITGRPFPLDGHTLGSIGEIYAAMFYGVELYKPGHRTHDGIWNGKNVQIKATQRNGTTYVKGETELLLVLQIMDDGSFNEIYNGDGKRPWNLLNRFGKPRKMDKMGDKTIPLNQLRGLKVELDDKIPRIK